MGFFLIQINRKPIEEERATLHTLLYIYPLDKFVSWSCLHWQFPYAVILFMFLTLTDAGLLRYYSIWECCTNGYAGHSMTWPQQVENRKWWLQILTYVI